MILEDDIVKQGIYLMQKQQFKGRKGLMALWILYLILCLSIQGYMFVKIFQQVATNAIKEVLGQ